MREIHKAREGNQTALYMAKRKTSPKRAPIIWKTDKVATLNAVDWIKGVYSDTYII